MISEQMLQEKKFLVECIPVIAEDQKIFPTKYRNLPLHPEALYQILPSEQVDKLLPGLYILQNILERAKKIYLSTHEYPDADGLGSQSALFLGLRQLGIEVIIANSDPAPDKYHFMDEEHILTSLPRDYPWPDLDQSVILLLDTNDFDRCGWIYDKIHDVIPRLFIIDHHVCEPKIAAKNLVVQNVAATGELIFFLLTAFGVHPTQTASKAIYTSILSDTGGFRYPATSVSTHLVAAELLRHPIDTQEIYEKIFSNFRPGRVMLMNPALQSLQILCDGRLAIIDINREQMNLFQVSAEDTDNIVNVPLQYTGILGSLFFREEEDGRFKVSMRSIGDLDVAALAQKFHGGGHKNAAGTKVSDTKAKQHLIQAFREAIEDSHPAL